jgi:hypothetical protein
VEAHIRGVVQQAHKYQRRSKGLSLQGRSSWISIMCVLLGLFAVDRLFCTLPVAVEDLNHALSLSRIENMYGLRAPGESVKLAKLTTPLDGSQPRLINLGNAFYLFRCFGDSDKTLGLLVISVEFSKKPISRVPVSPGINMQM